LTEAAFPKESHERIKPEACVGFPNECHHRPCREPKARGMSDDWRGLRQSHSALPSRTFVD
jgi:hypothetical protein